LIGCLSVLTPCMQPSECCFFQEICNINWRDVQRKDIVNNVDMSSLRASWQNAARIKTNTHNNTETRRTPRRNRHSEEKNNIFCVFRIFLFHVQFLKWFLQNVCIYRLCTANDFHWAFKLVFRYSKPHNYSTFIGK